MFPPIKKLTPQQKQLVMEYMDTLCKDLSMEENGAVFMISIAVATCGVSLAEPSTLKALEVVTNYTAFIQGITK